MCTLRRGLCIPELVYIIAELSVLSGTFHRYNALWCPIRLF